MLFLLDILLLLLLKLRNSGWWTLVLLIAITFSGHLLMTIQSLLVLDVLLLGPRCLLFMNWWLWAHHVVCIIPRDSWLMCRFGTRVLIIHFDSATQWIALQLLLLHLVYHLVLIVVVLKRCDWNRLHLMELLVCLSLSFLLLHLHLLLNASNLISHIHCIWLDLHCHLLRLACCFWVSLPNHPTHIDLLLSKIHHTEVIVNLELLVPWRSAADDVLRTGIGAWTVVWVVTWCNKLNALRGPNIKLLLSLMLLHLHLHLLWTLVDKVLLVVLLHILKLVNVYGRLLHLLVVRRRPTASFCHFFLLNFSKSLYERKTLFEFWLLGPRLSN